MQTAQPMGQPHRNQGLFSDHYPNVMLPARPDWNALTDEARNMMQEIANLLEAYTPSENEAQVEEDLVRPILRLIGHTFEVQPALATPEGTKRRKSASVARRARDASRPAHFLTSETATPRWQIPCRERTPRPAASNAGSPTS